MTDIVIFDTKQGKKVPLKPIDEKNVRMYVCGPTVYDDIHIGNARPLIVFDLLYRLLQLKYGHNHVTYVRNITDIDDKIIARAKERNITVDELTRETTNGFREITKALGCHLPPEQEPLATQYIGAMMGLIQKLLDGGIAYHAEGHILFEVAKWQDYGKFAKKPLDDLIAGARVEVAPYKKSPLDFVLWKPSKEGEPHWQGDFMVAGKKISITGRPGWHIECSAMAEKLLGEKFDIHGGGQDLIFPHHQNEIAQSCAVGHGFANYWMHNGFVMVEGKKMSKSEGNFITVKDLLEKRKIPLPVLKILMLMTHYRQPLDFTERKLGEANAIERKLKEHVIATESLATKESPMDNMLEYFGNNFEELQGEVIKMLSDDLNSVDFIKSIHKTLKEYNITKEVKHAAFLNMQLFLLGLKNASSYLQNLDNAVVVTNNKFGIDDLKKEQQIKKLIDGREKAKKLKDFTSADEIREEIKKMGFEIRDRKGKSLLIQIPPPLKKNK